MTTLNAQLIPTSAPVPVDTVIGRFAEAHHGLFTTRAAGRLGVSDKAIRHRRDTGRLVPIHPGVMRVAGAPLSLEQSLLAACWSFDSLAVASHRAACHVWGLAEGFEPLVEVEVERDRSYRPEGVLVHRSGDLQPDHHTTVNGIPVTTVARTLADLGAVLPWWKVSRVLEIANYKRLVTIAEVRTIRDELSAKGRAGIGILGEVLDRRGLGDADTNSPLESVFAQLRRDYDLEEPAYQHPLMVAGRQRFIDFAYPHYKIAIEIQGFETHTRVGVFHDDCVRGNELVRLGWIVLEFTQVDLETRPGYVVSVINDMIRRAQLAGRV